MLARWRSEPADSDREFISKSQAGLGASVLNIVLGELESWSECERQCTGWNIGKPFDLNDYFNYAARDLQTRSSRSWDHAGQVGLWTQQSVDPLTQQYSNNPFYSSRRMKLKIQIWLLIAVFSPKMKTMPFQIFQAGILQRNKKRKAFFAPIFVLILKILNGPTSSKL